MAEVLTLEVATPLGLQLRTEAESVEAPSVKGEFGVFAGHLPLLAALKPGVLRYRLAGKTYVAAVGAGFVEAEPDKVLLLTDQFMQPASIDVAQAESDMAEADKAIAAFGNRHEGREYEELNRRLEWARARIQAKSEER
jgi:F-type H+-transporting ATPase subunit epsilon